MKFERAKKATPKQSEKPSVEGQSQKRKFFSMLLPSGRMARFRVATLRDIFDIEEDTQREVLRRTEGMTQQALLAKTRQVLPQVAFKKLLCGITEEPVPSIQRKDGIAVAIASVKAMYTERERRKREFSGEDFDADEFSALIDESDEQFAFDVETASLDLTAMDRTARYTDVHDLFWTSPTGYVERMLDLDTVTQHDDEFIDYRAMLKQLEATLDAVPDPKAKRRTPMLCVG
jgi:hypothetical protein